MAKLTLVEQINDHQLRYPHMYTPGASMSFKQFRRIANFIQPGLRYLDPSNTRAAVQFVIAQGKINRVLSQKGLKLKSSNYYQTWYIAEDSDKEVTTMYNRSRLITNAANRLHTGIKQYKCNPTTRLTTAALAQTASYIDAKLF